MLSSPLLLENSKFIGTLCIIYFSTPLLSSTCIPQDPEMSAVKKNVYKYKPKVVSLHFPTKPFGTYLLWLQLYRE